MTYIVFPEILFGFRRKRIILYMLQNFCNKHIIIYLYRVIEVHSYL